MAPSLEESLPHSRGRSEAVLIRYHGLSANHRRPGHRRDGADLSYAVNVRDLHVAFDLEKVKSYGQIFEHVLDLA